MSMNACKLTRYTLAMTCLVACGTSADIDAPDVGAPGVGRSSQALVVAARPFPQQVAAGNLLRPSHLSQTQLNQDVQAYYQRWRSKYVQPSNGVTPGGGYFVRAGSTGEAGDAKSNSEAHGYGMILAAIMGDQPLFDGLYNMFNRHRSPTNGHLMSWVIPSSERSDEDQGSATDGDFDIAYALLLAHDQWGAQGTVNYLAAARDLITLGIKPSEMDAVSKRTTLGDWDTQLKGSRISDWMPGHMRAFHAATSDAFWLQSVDAAYASIAALGAQYSTGLVPDFVSGRSNTPAPPNFLEGPNDGAYYYNSCRVPLRLAVDFMHSGSSAARAPLQRLATWSRNQSGSVPSKLIDGYALNGDAIGTYASPAFVAPLMLAGIVDSANQTLINRGWDWMKASWASNNPAPAGYYEDTLTLLSMLALSGNWWGPSGGVSSTSGGGTTTPPVSTTPGGANNDPNLPLAQKLSAGKTSSASSTEDNNAQRRAALAFDGDPSTRWASQPFHDPEWLSVDLGSVQQIGQIVLNWEAAYATTYRIEVSSDGAAWTQVFRTTTGDGGLDEITLSTSARFVRLVGERRANGDYGYSLYEFEVWGPGRRPVPKLPPYGATVVLRSRMDGDYVSAWLDNEARLKAHANRPDTWEEFTLVDAGAGGVALRAEANGSFVTVADEANAPLAAWNQSIDARARFRWVDTEDGFVQLQSLYNGRYAAMAPTTAYNPIQAIEPSITEAARFTYKIIRGAPPPPPDPIPSDPSGNGDVWVARKQRVLGYLNNLPPGSIVAGHHNKCTPGMNAQSYGSDAVRSLTGKDPGFWSSDFLCEGWGSSTVDWANGRRALVAEAKRQWQAGALVNLMWHACPPGVSTCSWSNEVQSDLSDEDWRQLLIEGSAVNQRWKTSMDDIATYLKDLESAGVVVLWRPLHEQNQSAFWWSSGPERSRNLFRFTHDYFEKTKGLRNLVWVWDMQDLDTNWAPFDPGPAYRDVGAFDQYRGWYDPQYLNLMSSIVGSQPIGIGESFYLPSQDVLRSQTRWKFFMMWPDPESFSFNTSAAWRDLYAASNVITRDEMPGWVP
jgi:endo-1,4-beta-D-glucanase Y